MLSSTQSPSIISMSSNGSYTFIFPTEKEALSFLTDINLESKIGEEGADKASLSYGFVLAPDQWNNARDTIRSLMRSSAPLDTFAENYIIKTLRCDESSFFLDFIDSVTGGEKKPLRLGDKGKFTVTGEGIFKRKTVKDDEYPDVPRKTSQYTPLEKAGYSKAQSVSLCAPDYSSPAYGLGMPRENVLVGVALGLKDNVLLTHRNYIHDVLSTGRPYEFETKGDAENYFIQNKGRILFPAHELQYFIHAIKQHPQDYNEMLARLRWTNQECKIIIARDTFESRLQAIEHARLLKKCLLRKNKINQNDSLSIIYYLPNTSLHLKSYTAEEQALDTIEAKRIYADKQQRHDRYNEALFQFLFAMSEVALKGALEELHEGKPLLWHILGKGLVHIAQSIVDKLGCDLYDMLAKTQNILSEFQEEAVYRLVKSGEDEVAVKYITAYQGTIAALNNFNKSSDQYDSETIAHLAVRLGKPAILHALHQHKVDFNKARKKDVVSMGGFPCTLDENITPLHLAASRGLTAMAACLVQLGCRWEEVTENGKSCLDLGVEESHVDIVELFIRQGGDLNVIGDAEPPLLAAAGMGNVKMVEYLLKKGAGINKKGPKGENALYKAVDYKKIKVLLFLLENGAEVNTLIYHNKFRPTVTTPLQAAIEDEFQDDDTCKIITLLFQHGADVHYKPTEPLLEGAVLRNPLMAAAVHDDIGFAQMVVDKKIDINAVDNEGNTAVHYAMYYRALSLLEFLIDHHADLHIQNNLGSAAVQVASSSSCLAMLTKALANEPTPDTTQNEFKR